MQFEIYKDSAGEWRWRLLALNGKIIGDSAEGYNKRSHAFQMVATIMAGADEADVTY